MSNIDAACAYIDQFGRDGSLRVKLCCDLTLYLEGSPQESRAGLLRLYERALALIGAHVKYVSSGKSTTFKPPPKNIATLLARWFDSGGPARGSYSLYLESGTAPDEVSDRAFAFVWALGQGYVRLMLPAASCAANPDAFRQGVIDIAAAIGFRSGHAGFSTNIDVDYDTSSPNGAIARISKRYLGVDLGKPLYWSDLTIDAIKTVNWLTLLGPRLLARAAEPMGGMQAFAAALGHGVALVPVGSGAMLQAGASPRLGDVEANETLPEYRQVAGALQRLRIADAVLRGYDGIGGSDNTRCWLDRFA